MDSKIGLWSIALLILLAACTQSDPFDGVAAEGEVGLTLGRIVEEIWLDPSTTVRFEIDDGSTLLKSSTYPVDFDGGNYRQDLTTIYLKPGRYEVRATVEPDGPLCEVVVNLEEVATSAFTLIRHECSFEVEETEHWHNSAGAPLDRTVIEEFYGGGHCGWESVRFIAFGEYFVGDAYLNDPAGVFPPETFVSKAARERLGLEFDDPANPANLEPDDYLTLDLEAELPEEAVSFGYQRGLRELYFSPSDHGDYIFVVSPNATERWPRALPHPGCA